jgi:uncharacterized membrane protein YozB (DUF420 family)
MFSGLWAIKSGKRELHKKLMLSAVSSSAIFLGLYLVYHFNVDSKQYEGSFGFIYFPVLISHIILAITVPFLVGKILWHAFRNEMAIHKKWARVTFPIWAYVSVTGIVVYFMVHT